ncbi:MAG: DNA methyltransferase [Gammaproteobacteria bacterium]|nr:DNA methyltransferase [Gammaproteobacteria bacterium]
MKPKKFIYGQRGSERYTHYLFRYPAKFHPPIAHALIEQFSDPGDIVLDPFCGSGTLLVEAISIGRNAIGVDIDPVAAYISRVKTMRISTTQLHRSAEKILDALLPHEKSEKEYNSLMFTDIDYEDVYTEAKAKNLYLPNIPNIKHWFRNYVLIDLATIRREISLASIPSRHREFFWLCFGSIIRNSSNADPVPVSGLEVTSYMLKLEKKGRLINPFDLFRKRITRSLKDWSEFQESLNCAITSVKIKHGDSTRVRRYVRTPVDVIITSPPYHNAVDYYRRHTLEMYWLGLVKNRQDRLALRSKYIGRQQVAKSDPIIIRTTLQSSLAKKWEKRMAEHSEQRARDFKHYVLSMTQTIAGLSGLLKDGGKAVFVVGKNSWNDYEIPTVELFDEIVGNKFKLIDRYWYPIKNRYMTYTRHNNANIDKEYVLVYEKN